MKNKEDIQDKDKSLIEHLEELRSTLIKCFLSLIFALPFSLYCAPKIFKYLINILMKNKELYYFAPMEVFLIQLKLACLVSLLVCFPYIIKKIWDYLLPALYENERKFIKRIVFSSTFLFLLGVLFCFLIILPLIINFAFDFEKSNVIAMFGVSNIINLALNLSFVFGLMFQIPLVTHFLIRFNIISYETVSSKRRYIIILLLIFSALLTPPDIISQILMFIPTYMLFELGLIFSRKTNKEIEKCQD